MFFPDLRHESLRDASQIFRIGRKFRVRSEPRFDSVRRRLLRTRNHALRQGNSPRRNRDRAISPSWVLSGPTVKSLIYTAQLIQKDVLIGCRIARIEKDTEMRQIVSQLLTTVTIRRIVILPSERLAAPLKNVENIPGIRRTPEPRRLEAVGQQRSSARSGESEEIPGPRRVTTIWATSRS